MEHKTQLTLTDEQVAFLLDCVQLAAVGLKRHEAAQTQKGFHENMALAATALDSFSTETFREMHVMLFKAAQEIPDENVMTGEEYLTEQKKLLADEANRERREPDSGPRDRFRPEDYRLN